MIRYIYNTTLFGKADRYRRIYRAFSSRRNTLFHSFSFSSMRHYYGKFYTNIYDDNNISNKMITIEECRYIQRYFDIRGGVMSKGFKCAYTKSGRNHSDVKILSISNISIKHLATKNKPF